MTFRSLLFLGLSAPIAACVSGKSVGELDDGGSDDAPATETSTPGDDDGSSGTDGPDPTAGDTGVPAECPDAPGSCASFDFCQPGECGHPLSQFDEDGCPRVPCGPGGACPEGRVCLVTGDWGSCGASSWGCEPFEGECGCGGTADCSESAAHCIPEEIAPPEVTRCIPPDPGASFTVFPPLGDTTGTADCTITGLAPLQLDCTGDFEGAYTVTLATAQPPELSMGEAVILEHYARAEIEWLDAWLRIRTADGLFTRAVAVLASELLPPDAPADFWPTNVEVAAGDIGCLQAYCSEEPGMFTGRAIRVGQGDLTTDYAAGESGMVPGKFGGDDNIVTVQEAREGACGATLGDQPGWFSFVIVQTPG